MTSTPQWVTNVGDVLAEQTTWTVPRSLLSDEPARRSFIDTVLEEVVSRFRGQHAGLEVVRYRVRYERRPDEVSVLLHVQLFMRPAVADLPPQEGTDG